MWIWARFYCLLPLPGWLVFLRGLEIRSWLWYTCVLKVEGSHSRVPKSDMEKPSLPCSSVTGLRPQCRDLPKGCTLSWRSARIADPWSLQLAALQPPEVILKGKVPLSESCGLANGASESWWVGMGFLVVLLSLDFGTVCIGVMFCVTCLHQKKYTRFKHVTIRLPQEGTGAAASQPLWVQGIDLGFWAAS